jgi:hypothetical protein
MAYFSNWPKVSLKESGFKQPHIHQKSNWSMPNHTTGLQTFSENDNTCRKVHVQNPQFIMNIAKPALQIALLLVTGFQGQCCCITGATRLQHLLYTANCIRNYVHLCKQEK